MRSRHLLLGLMGLTLAACNQLTPAQDTRLYAKLSPASEVTAPSITTQKEVWGWVGGTYKDDTLAVTGKFFRLSGTPTSAKVYLGKIGTEGPAVCELTVKETGTNADDSTKNGDLSGSCNLKDQGLKGDLLKAGQYYVNIITAQNPTGEIRGQLLLE